MKNYYLKERKKSIIYQIFILQPIDTKKIASEGGFCFAYSSKTKRKWITIEIIEKEIPKYWWEIISNDLIDTHYKKK